MKRTLDGKPLSRPAAAAAAEGAAAATAAAALAADEHKRKVEEALACAVCLSLVWDPVTPACAHTSCFACLSAVVDSEAPAPKCPTCRAPITTLPISWSVNAQLASLIELNAGPAFRERAGLLRLHDALRAGAPADALAALAAHPGMDLSSPLRLASGEVTAVLNHALSKAREQPWVEVAEALIKGGAGVDEGKGALDSLPGDVFCASLAELILGRGAKKCTAQGLLRVACSCYRVKSGRKEDRSFEVDGVLLRLLPLLPASERLSAKAALDNCILNGHSRAALEMIDKMAVRPSDPASSMCVDPRAQSFLFFAHLRVTTFTFYH